MYLFAALYLIYVYKKKHILLANKICIDDDKNNKTPGNKILFPLVCMLS